MINLNRMEMVRNRARQLHKKYNLSVPVNLDTVISSKNIALEYKENEFGIDGWCELKTAQPKIVINSEIWFEPRRRFTLAHEIGHICIPWHTGVNCCVLNDPYVQIEEQKLIDSQEEEANTFASELLMPTDWLTSKFDLDTKDLKALINNIRNTANTSIMASFYALAHVLPNCNMFMIRTNRDVVWRAFFSDGFQGGVWVSKVQEKLFDQISIFKNNFSISIYEVKHYKLLPCPPKEVIRSVYVKSGYSFENLLNTLSDYEPIRLINHLNTIINALDDKYVVIVQLGDSYYRRFYHPKTSIRIRVDNDCDVGECYQYIQTNFTEYGRIEMGQGGCLLWVKEVPVELPIVFAERNHKLLLKKIVDDLIYGDQTERTHWIQKINGIMSCIYTETQRSTFTKEEMYQKAKIRFETDPDLFDFVQHSDFECYLQSKISSLIKNGKKI